MSDFAKKIRTQFPLFSGENTVPHYLDSAASAQKPAVVIERLSNFLKYEHANIHRGAYALSANATDNYEKAREGVAKFISANASSIIFTKGTTESINLVSYALQRSLKKDDKILVSLIEHHSNIVPWQLLKQRIGVDVVFSDITDDAELDLIKYKKNLLEYKPKIVAICQVANSFGTVMPLEEIIFEAHKVGALVLVDAAQSIQHKAIDVKKLDADFLVFSGHKIYGPTGIGVLYVKPGIEERLEPFQGGGDMISNVSIEGSTWAEFPQKFEAGTPPIAEAIALGSAVDFVSSVGLSAIEQHERELFIQAWELLSKEEGVVLYGAAKKHGTSSGKQVSIIPFNVTGIHPHDVSTIVDSLNVQIRAGHHCAMPALKRLGLESSARASIGMYNQIEDFQVLVEGIRKAKKMFIG
jgi:cysteine desulfurase / selenocysteine lyase